MCDGGGSVGLIMAQKRREERERGRDRIIKCYEREPREREKMFVQQVQRFASLQFARFLKSTSPREEKVVYRSDRIGHHTNTELQLRELKETAASLSTVL